jgi:hypothetical protein
VDWSTLAYKPVTVQSASTFGNLVYAVAPDPGSGSGSGSGSGTDPGPGPGPGSGSGSGSDPGPGPGPGPGQAPGFGDGSSGGGSSGNGQTSGGIREITVSDLEQYDFTFALGRALGSHYVRGGLHLVSANEAAIDGSYSGFLEWQYTRPRDYFLRLGLASGKRLDDQIRANQFDITAGKEFGNPVLSGVWQLQLNYLLGDNDWSGVGSNTSESVEAAVVWSRGKWRLETSAWAGERMYALLKRGYYLVTQQDLLTGGYRLGAGYSLGAGSLQLYYEYTRLEPTAQTESEVSTIGIQYHRGIM